MRRDGCIAFLQWALPRLGMRWAGFRKVRGQVCKRIKRRIEELRLSGCDEYRVVLEAEPHEWRVLDSFCRVTISRFYRDRGVFQLIGDRLLPELAITVGQRARAAGAPHRDRVLRCWSAGCASGEEPYTLAILWQLHHPERLPGIRLDVIATDADEALLQRARTACYPASTLRELPAEWVEIAFEPRDGELCLRPPFREGVHLSQQDIRFAMPAGPFHLLLCRNLVFTYFEPALQARLLSAILEKLLPGGFLVLGAHEELPGGDWPLERAAAAEPVFRRT
jgi:chemotaxis protein methyltransferase CheR